MKTVLVVKTGYVLAGPKMCENADGYAEGWKVEGRRREVEE